MGQAADPALLSKTLTWSVHLRGFICSPEFLWDTTDTLQRLGTRGSVSLWRISVTKTELGPSQEKD